MYILCNSSGGVVLKNPFLGKSFLPVKTFLPLRRMMYFCSYKCQDHHLQCHSKCQKQKKPWTIYNITQHKCLVLPQMMMRIMKTPFTYKIMTYLKNNVYLHCWSPPMIGNLNQVGKLRCQRNIICFFGFSWLKWTQSQIIWLT